MDLLSNPLGQLGGVWKFRSSFPNVLTRGFMWGMVGSLAMFISSWDKTDRMRDQYLQKHRSYGDTYDFIIVGGGTAGSIVAHRLSEFYKVLLLEAGGAPHPFTSIPLMANFMTNYPELDWSHLTTPQKHAFFASHENQGRISGGKGLGGSSNLDYMIYLRGSPQDYEMFKNATGDPSWSYQNLLKYFKRFEKYQGTWNNTKMHGTSGEMRIGPNDFNMKMAKRFVAAGNEMGIPHADLNADYQEGFDMLSYPIGMGHRQMAYKAFLKRPASDRWHLVVHKYAHVNKILIRGDSNEAYGVSYDRHGESVVAYARKEIILSAGTINSPRILMHSGVGDSNHLQNVGIPAKVHLPQIGTNLQDHVGVYLGPFYTYKGQTLLIDRDVNSASLLQFTMGQGPLTSTGYVATGMLTSEQERMNGNPSWPDISMTLHNMALHSTSAEDFSHAHNIRKDILDPYFDNKEGQDSFQILVTVGRPKSRGQITLKNNDPYSPPDIDPRYFEEISDVGVMVDGIKKALRLVEGTVHFGGQLGARFTNATVSPCAQWRFRSDEYWACYSRLMTVSVGDVGGTCAMGSVVDNELRVRGVERLRVIDASVMPNLPSGGLTAATMMIGEKGADLILTLWGQQHKADKFNKDRNNMRDILKSTQSIIKGINTPSMFMDNLKNTESFKTLSQKDLEGAMDSPGGILKMFRRHRKEGERKMNPFKVIGAMFKNSLTSITSNDTKVQTPKTPTTTTTTTTTAAPEIYFTTAETPQQVETLFGPEATTNSNGIFAPSGYISYPFEEIWLKPTTQSNNAYVLQPKPFSIIEPSIHSGGFSLPIISNSNVNNNNQEKEFANALGGNKDLQSYIAKYINNRQTRADSTTPKVPSSPILKIINSSPLRLIAKPLDKFISDSIPAPEHFTTTTTKPVVSITYPYPSQLASYEAPELPTTQKSMQIVPHPEVVYKIISTSSAESIPKQSVMNPGMVSITNPPPDASYEAQMTQEDNTFSYPSAELLDKEETSATDNSAIVYNIPQKIRNSNFALSVQNILEQSGNINFQPILSQIPPTPISNPNLYNSKLVSEEMQKIFADEKSFYRPNLHLDRMKIGPMFQRQRDHVQFSKIISRILEKQKLKHQGLNFGEFRKPLSMSTSSNSVSGKRNFKSIWSSNGQRDKNMSFSIKILNH